MLRDGGGAGVYNRRTILTASLMAVLAESAIADPFDWSPRDVGIAVNDRLRSAGLDLRIRTRTVRGVQRVECRFSSARTFLVATGRVRPPRTREIMIVADLLATDAAGDVRDQVAAATAAWGAAMESFDPGLQPDLRSRLLSDLSGTALRDGRVKATGSLPTIRWRSIKGP